jgi:hypothetical protein
MHAFTPVNTRVGELIGEVKDSGAGVYAAMGALVTVKLLLWRQGRRAARLQGLQAVPQPPHLVYQQDNAQTNRQRGAMQDNPTHDAWLCRLVYS